MPALVGPVVDTSIKHYSLIAPRVAVTQRACDRGCGLNAEARLDMAMLSRRLQLCLPRLIYAGINRFPVPGGNLEAGNGCTLSVLAVRAEPVQDRLDKGIASELDALVRGRGPVQLEERLLRLQFDGVQATDGIIIHVDVCWHTVAGFAVLLLRGNPACVEAMHSSEPPLFAGKEWNALHDVFNKCHHDGLLAGKSYRTACTGAVLRLAKPAGGKKRQQGCSSLEGMLDDVGSCLSQTETQAAAALCQRALATAPCVALRSRTEDMVAKLDSRKAEWWALAQDLMTAAAKQPHSSGIELPAEAVDAWVDGILQEDFSDFATSCHNRKIQTTLGMQPALAVDALESDWAERLAAAWPCKAGLIFMAHTGSFMYGLNLPSSDSDFSIVFLGDSQKLVSRIQPRTRFEHHVQGAFGSHKQGEIEYSGTELGPFLVDLAKGNARTVELLFTEKPHVASPAWLELRERRRTFLTVRCANQYFGFIKDRVCRAATELEGVSAGVCSLPSDALRRIGKLLYHAYHKVFELRRILAGGQPIVELVGEEHRFVMNLRLSPPSCASEALAAVDAANMELETLGVRLKAVSVSGELPAEVDAGFLVAWLQSVRVRHVAGATVAATALTEVTAVSDGGPLSVPGGRTASAPSTSPMLHRSRSISDEDAIEAILCEIEQEEGFRIVHAGYSHSSRTLGTAHAGSDHDVKLIFVLPRSVYFGLRRGPQTFARSFEAVEGMAPVEVSGWEARHACRLLMDSNPAVLAMLHSPVVFKTTRWASTLMSLATETMDIDMLLSAWRWHGLKTFQNFIADDESPIRKRYVHALRPLLCHTWMRSQPKGKWPPHLLLDLACGVAEAVGLSSRDMEAVRALVANSENLSRPLPHVTELDALIKRLLADTKEKPGSVFITTSGESEKQHSRGEVESQWHALCAAIVDDLSSAETPPS